MRLKLLLLPLLISISTIAQAQTLFEDSKGESSIFLSNMPYGWVRVNSSSESVTLGYNRLRPAGHDGTTRLLRSFKYMYGTDFTFKMKDGLGNLVSKGKVNAGGSVNFTLGVSGQDTSKKPVNPYALYARGGFTYDKYTMIDTIAATAADVKKWGWGVALHYNKQWARPNSDNTRRTFLLFGASFGIKGGNNTDDLKDGSLNTTIVSSGQKSVVTSQDGKLGQYQGLTTLPLKLDFGVSPTIYGANIVGFNAYWRTSFRTPGNPTNLGMGMFFSGKDRPTSVIGGIAWQLNDIFHETQLVNTSSVFFYVGYTIK